MATNPRFGRVPLKIEIPPRLPTEDDIILEEIRRLINERLNRQWNLYAPLPSSLSMN